MKPSEAISLADQLKANMMSSDLKLRFLNEIEARVHGEIIMKCEHTTAQEECPVYTLPDSPGDEEPDMLVPDKYAMMYPYWIESKIDEQDREWDDYNNHRTLFEAEWNNFFDSYIQDHMPLTAAATFTV